MLLTTALALAACEDDKKASFSGFGAPLAVDSYLIVHFGDACIGRGLPVCRTEAIAGHVTVRIDDPEVARIVPNDEWPEEFEPGVGRVLIQGVWPGTTRLHGRARFSDGSERSTSTKIPVRRADSLALEVECEPKAEAKTRVLPGREIEFRLVPMAGDKPLAGSFLDPVEGDEATCTTGCRWRAPDEGGEVQLRSQWDPKFRGTISTYTPDGVTEVIAEKPANARILGPGQIISFNTDVAIRGRRPCHDLPAQVKTLTPRVCVGPDGESAWSGEFYGIEVKGLQDGTCKLQLGAEGAEDYPSDVLLTLRVVSEFTINQSSYAGEDCDQEGAITCATDFQHMLTCKGGAWVDGKKCGSKVCEMHVRGEGGCKLDEGCPYCR